MNSHSQCLVFELIKIKARSITAKPWEYQKAWITELDDAIRELTPTEFSQIFPVTKEYKGRFWGFKDYYTVNEWISEHVGWNNKIPDGVAFMMEYLNRDVKFAAVQVMHILNTFHQRQTGEDALAAWAKSNGIHIRRVDSD